MNLLSIRTGWKISREDYLKPWQLNSLRSLMSFSNMFVDFKGVTVSEGAHVNSNLKGIACCESRHEGKSHVTSQGKKVLRNRLGQIILKQDQAIKFTRQTHT